MCGSAYTCSNEPEGWIGGFYEIYPVEEALPELSERGWANIDFDRIRTMFSDCLEAYCVFAFIAIVVKEEEGWAGATWHYLDRLAIGGLRRDHGREAWKRLGKWILSFGRSKELTRTDLFILLWPSFTQLFWRSMKSLASRGYVRVEQREIDSVDVDVFFPTARLIDKLNCCLPD